MGLYNHASDFSPDSIPILAVIALANFVTHLRSLAFSLLNLSRDDVHVDIQSTVGSGLVNLAEQLNLNRACSYRSKGEPGSKCVVCLSGLKEGQHVRRLGCCHVFHKECFEGWLLHGFNFSCPLCRVPVGFEQHVECVPPRVGRDLFNFFSLWR